MRTLIKNAQVALPDGLSGVSVLVEDDKIADIDPAAQLTADRTVDASGPGFFETS